MYGKKPKHANMKGQNMDHARAKWEDYAAPTKPKHGMASPTKIRVISWKNNPKKHIEMIARKLRHEGIHNGSCLRH